MTPDRQTTPGEPETPETSESWGGQLRCVVTNATGQRIYNLSVWHRFADYSDGPGSIDELDHGDTVSFSMNLGPGYGNYWDVWCQAEDKDVLTCNNKRCDVEKADYDSGEAVRLIIGSRTVGFDIVLPRSTSCMGNRYDT